MYYLNIGLVTKIRRVQKSSVTLLKSNFWFITVQEIFLVNQNNNQAYKAMRNKAQQKEFTKGDVTRF